MRCPFCHHTDTQVTNTRDSKDGHLVRRRRHCSSCQQRFTTYESPHLQLPRIIKKDGTREDFDREKLENSLSLALRKRPVPTEAISNCIAHIEGKLMRLGLREVDSAKIGDAVMHELKKLDKVSYVRFASVYRNFEDVQDFSSAIQEVDQNKS